MPPMQWAQARYEALDAVQRWIIAERDDAAKGSFMAALVHMLIGMLDAIMAAQMLELGLDATAAAPLTDLERVPSARAHTLQALCAMPDIHLRGGMKPGLVVSDDARQRIMRGLGLEE